MRGDLIEVFKILKGMENVDPNLYFVRALSTTPGHSLKLFKPACRLDVRKHFFSNRVVDIWNSLTPELIACDSTNTFKSQLDKFLKGRGFI